MEKKSQKEFIIRSFQPIFFYNLKQNQEFLFQNIDGGWIEGRNVRGSVGLFPESYVTPYQASRPPPVTHLSSS